MTVRMGIVSGGIAIAIALAAAFGLVPAAVAASATPAGPSAAAAQAVAGLLDNPGTGGLNGVAALLNRLLTGPGL